MHRMSINGRLNPLATPAACVACASAWTRSVAVMVMIAIAVAGTASAQSFNIDFGEPENKSADSYAGAGLAGFWNAMIGEHGETYIDLIDINGNSTDAMLTQIGGLDTLLDDDPETTGGDDTLMDDFLITYNEDLESCVNINNLSLGWYEVIIYAWMPNRPEVFQYTSVDEEPDMPFRTVGGPWSDGHAELVTYSRHFAHIGGDGHLGLHSGIVPGHDPDLGAALNGVQIIHIPSSETTQLIGFEIERGVHLDGNLIDLVSSDDQRLRLRSRPGFFATEPNVMELIVAAHALGPGSATIDLTMESYINHPVGTAKISLRNWTTDQFDQIGQHTIGVDETSVEFNGIEADDFVSDDDARIELSIRHIVVATFTASGFDSAIDFAEIGVN